MVNIMKFPEEMFFSSKVYPKDFRFSHHYSSFNSEKAPKKLTHSKRDFIYKKDGKDWIIPEEAICLLLEDLTYLGFNHSDSIQDPQDFLAFLDLAGSVGKDMRTRGCVYRRTKNSLNMFSTNEYDVSLLTFGKGLNREYSKSRFQGMRKFMSSYSEHKESFPTIGKYVDNVGVDVVKKGDFLDNEEDFEVELSDPYLFTEKIFKNIHNDIGKLVLPTFSKDSKNPLIYEFYCCPNDDILGGNYYIFVVDPKSLRKKSKRFEKDVDYEIWLNEPDVSYKHEFSLSQKSEILYNRKHL